MSAHNGSRTAASGYTASVDTEVVVLGAGVDGTAEVRAAGETSMTRDVRCRGVGSEHRRDRQRRD